MSQPTRLLRVGGFHLRSAINKSTKIMRPNIGCSSSFSATYSRLLHSTSKSHSVASSVKSQDYDRPLSYHCELATAPLVNWTYGHSLNKQAATTPDKPAFVFVESEKEYTFAEFHDQVDRCAKGLLASGLSKGDCLMIFCPNTPNWLVMFAACAKLGILSASVHPAYTKQEFFNALEKTKPKAIFIPDVFKTIKFYENLCKWIPELPSSSPGQLNSSQFPSVKSVIVDSPKNLPGTVNLKEILQGSSADLEQAEKKVGCDDPLTVIFTSGTTGAAKAACLIHHAFINNCIISHELAYRSDDEFTPVILNPLPLFHVFGLMFATIPIVSGVKTVFPAVGYDQVAVMKAIEKYKCTQMAGSPTMYVDLMHHPERPKYDLSSLEFCVMGATICTPELRKEVEQNFGAKALTGYGATETSTVCSVIRRDDPYEKRMTSVGRPLPHIEMKIANPETGVELPCGEAGEVWIRSFNIFNGYLSDEAKTKEVITPSRWYKSGDVGTMDSEGFVYIVGRLKDLIIRGGENVHPIDIEIELDNHPAIEESHVIGVPDQRLGEEICAVVVLNEGAKVTAEELKEYLKNKIAYFKIPKYFLFEVDIPRTAIGKAQKNKMRVDAAKKLGL